MNIYINGLGNVSPQNTTDNEVFLEEIRNEKAKSLWCVEPIYKELLAGVNLRRMSRLMKIGIYSAQLCINDAEQPELDAIITGTGLGFQADTEKFLTNIFGNEEGLVSPTQFIQSTHNGISGKIALLLNCEKYNFTYVNRGASFECALLDGMMQIEEEANNILIGGFDELTENFLNITNRMRLWKNRDIHQLDLLKNDDIGSMPGEGAAFFMLGKKPTKKCYAVIKGMRILFKPKTNQLVEHEITALLKENDLSLADIDVCMLGLNGDKNIDNSYKNLQNGLLTNLNICYYKHLCGEYKTASSFGLWAACQILAKQNIPEVLKLNSFENKRINNLLLYNNYNNSNHSILLIQKSEG